MEDIRENFQIFTYKKEGIRGRNFNEKLIQKYCSLLKQGDSINVVVSCDSIALDIYNPLQKGEFDRIKESLTNYLEDELSIEIHIQKSMEYGYVNIYSYEHFCNYLEERELPKLFSEFSEIIRLYGAVRCYVCDKDVDLELNSFIFSNNFERINKKSGIEKKFRDSVLEKLHMAIYVQEDNIGEVIPHDFKVIVGNNADDIRMFFEQILMILCISCIANYCELKEYSIIYRLMGYKMISGEYSTKNTNNITNVVDNFLRLIMWIYAEDFNSVDKCEIARNILSLHIKNNWQELGEESYMAIISSYRVYLKTSVDHYLEIKNEVVDKITEINDKIFESAKEFTTSLKNSILALFSFFVTTLVVNTIATGKIENIFTEDIVTLSYGFIVISGIYILVMYQELKRKKIEIKDIYNNGKELYVDVLSREDICNIYCNDSIFNKNMKMMENLVIKYSVCWAITMLVIFVVITNLKVENLI